MILQIAAGIVLGFFALWTICANDFYLVRITAFIVIMGALIGVMVIPVYLAYVYHSMGYLWLIPIVSIGLALREDIKDHKRKAIESL